MARLRTGRAARGEQETGLISSKPSNSGPSRTSPGAAGPRRPSAGGRPGSVAGRRPPGADPDHLPGPAHCGPRPRRALGTHLRARPLAGGQRPVRIGRTGAAETLAVPGPTSRGRAGQAIRGRTAALAPGGAAACTPARRMPRAGRTWKRWCWRATCNPDDFGELAGWIQKSWERLPPADQEALSDLRRILREASTFGTGLPGHLGPGTAPGRVAHRPLGGSRPDRAGQPGAAALAGDDSAGLWRGGAIPPDAPPPAHRHRVLWRDRQSVLNPAQRTSNGCRPSNGGPRPCPWAGTDSLAIQVGQPVGPACGVAPAAGFRTAGGAADELVESAGHAPSGRGVADLSEEPLDLPPLWLRHGLSA